MHATASCVALLGIVRLSGVAVLPSFVRFGFRIDRQLRNTPGVFGYRIGADVSGLAFYHLSAWKNSEAIQDFVDTAPHVDAVDQLGARLGETAFRYWQVTGADLPMHLRRELHRLQVKPST